ncbi:uncharacterized [Tachysurus ichikawai]
MPKSAQKRPNAQSNEASNDSTMANTDHNYEDGGANYMENEEEFPPLSLTPSKPPGCYCKKQTAVKIGGIRMTLLVGW